MQPKDCACVCSKFAGDAMRQLDMKPAAGWGPVQACFCTMMLCGWVLHLSSPPHSTLLTLISSSLTLTGPKAAAGPHTSTAAVATAASCCPSCDTQEPAVHGKAVEEGSGHICTSSSCTWAHVLTLGALHCSRVRVVTVHCSCCQKPRRCDAA